MMVENKSTLISGVIAALTIRRIAAGTLRSCVATLHLITTTVSSCTAGHRARTALHLTVALRRYPWATRSPVPSVTTTAWTGNSHRGLIWRISRHRAGRMWSTLRSHGLRANILRKCVVRRHRTVTWSLRLLRRVSVELTGRRTILAPLHLIWLVCLAWQKVGYYLRCI